MYFIAASIGITAGCAKLGGADITLGADAPSTVSIRYTSSTVAKSTSGEVYVNGESKTTMNQGENWSGPGKQAIIGNRSSKAKPYIGKIHAIRVYSRRLTAVEIAKNAEIDRNRFIEGTGSPLSETLSVNGLPEKFGPAENYALRTFSSGATAQLSMPETVTENGVLYRCTGWAIKDVNDTVLLSGAGNVCDYTHPGAARRLVWQWQADAWPTGEGARYVSPDGSDANTGADWCHAFKTVQKGIDSVGADGVVLISSGTHGSDTTVWLTNGVSLVGCAKTNATAVLRLTATEDKTKNVLKIASSAGSVVTNLTFTNNMGMDGSGIEMDSGLLTHCIVRECRTYNLTDQGGGINMTGGTVRQCDITGCIAKDSGGGGAYGGGIYMTGGLVENCRITKNGIIESSGVGSAGCGGGVFMTGGTLRGCLIAGNRKYVSGSGVYASGGTVENCTIVGNRQNAASATATGVYVGGSKTVFRNNIVWDNTDYAGTTAKNWASYNVSAANIYNNDCPDTLPGEDNLTVNPQFADAESGDYRLGFSDCVDGGANQEWMAGATDMDGHSRIIGTAVDLGCYERVAAQGLECSFVAEIVDATLDLHKVALAATVVGDTEGLVYYWTFTRAADGLVTKVSGADCAIVTNMFATGAWNARLDVTNGVEDAANSEIASAFSVRGSVVYVKKNATPVFPYSTPETATDSIDAAFPLLGEGGTMYVDEGEYVITEPIVLGSGNGSRILAPKGPDKTAMRVGNVTKFTTDKYRAVTLSKDSAFVSGFTFAGGYPGPHYSGATYGIYGVASMTAAGATLTNCVIRDVREATYGKEAEGMGVKMSAGLVVDCWFENISSQGSGGAGMDGGVIRMTGGTADRIVVDRCFCNSGSIISVACYGDIIYAEGVNTVVKNALVARCRTTKSVSFGMRNGSVVNCTIACNTNNAPITYTDDKKVVRDNCQSAGVAVYESGTVKNCIVADNWAQRLACVSNLYGTATYTLVDDRDASFVTAENRNRVGDPRFKNVRRGDYRILGTSPAVNAGDWTALGETREDVAAQRDLLGGSRLVGPGVDMGCYEIIPRGLLLLFR